MTPDEIATIMERLARLEAIAASNQRMLYIVLAALLGVGGLAGYGVVG